MRMIGEKRLLSYVHREMFVFGKDCGFKFKKQNVALVQSGFSLTK